MANYTSQPQRFNKPTSSINLAYIDSTIKQKSAQIDENYGIMSQTVDKVLGQDLIREEDREYLRNKLTDVITTLQNTDSIKFSSRRSKFVIQDGLAQAARDPEVLKQIANTKSIRSYAENIQAAKKDGTYSEDNDKYARYISGYNQYMSGEANDINGLTYQKYHDHSKEAREHFKDIQEEYELRKSVTQTEDGQNITVEDDGLTPVEIRMMISNRMSSQAKLQMGIEGAVQYNFDNKAAQQDVSTIITNTEKEKQAKIKTLNAQIKDGMSPAELEQIENQIARTEQIYDAQLSNWNRLTDKSALAIGRSMTEDSYMRSLVSDSYRNPLVTKIEKNDAFFEKIKLENERLELLEKNGTVGGSIGNDLNQNGSTDISSTPVTTDLINDELETVIDTQYQMIQEQKEGINEWFGNTFDKMSTEDKNAVAKIEEAITLAAKKRGVSLSPMQFNQEVYRQAREAKIIGGDDNIDIRIAAFNANLKDYQNDYNTAKDKYYDKNSPEVYKEVLSNPKMLMYDQKGREVNINQYLKDNGIDNAKKFNDFIKSPKGNLFRANAKLNSIGEYALEYLTEDTQQMFSPKGAKNMLEGIKSALQELDPDANIDDYVEVTKYQVGFENFGDNLMDSLTNIMPVAALKVNDRGAAKSVGSSGISEKGGYTVKAKEGTPLYDFIKANSKTGGDVYIGNTLASVSESRKTFNPTGEEFRDFRKEQSKLDPTMMAGNNVITIEASGSGKDQKVEAYESLKKNPNLAWPEDQKGNAFLRMLPNGQVNVLLRRKIQEDDPEEGSAKTKYSYTSIGTISENEIDSPQLRQYVDFQNKTNALDYMVETEQMSYKPVYTNQNSKRADFQDEMRPLVPQAVYQKYSQLYTQDGMKSYLNNIIKVGERMQGSDQKDIEVSKKLASHYQNNFNDYRLRLSGNSNNKSMELVYIGKQDTKISNPPPRVIGSRELPPNTDMDQFQKLFFNYPSIYMAEVLGQTINNINLGRESSASDFIQSNPSLFANN